MSCEEWDPVDAHLMGFRRAPEFAPFLEAIKPHISQTGKMQHYMLTLCRQIKEESLIVLWPLPGQRKEKPETITFPLESASHLVS